MYIANAKLVRKKTPDGLVELWEDVPIGKIYKIDLDSLRFAKFYNIPFGKEHTKQIVTCVDDGPNFGTYLFMDCLQIISQRN